MKTQTIRSVFENALKNERHDKNSETRFWCGQFKLLAKLAIEQLEKQAIAEAEKHTLSGRINDARVHVEYDKQRDAAMKLIEAEKQEPVAWKHYTKPLERRLQHLETKEHQNSFDKHEAAALRHVLDIVTQPKREPLTVEQLREHWQVAKVLDMTDAEIDFADYLLIARDVEALYGIKGDA